MFVLERESHRDRDQLHEIQYWIEVLRVSFGGAWMVPRLAGHHVFVFVTALAAPRGLRRGVCQIKHLVVYGRRCIWKLFGVSDTQCPS